MDFEILTIGAALFIGYLILQNVQHPPHHTASRKTQRATQRERRGEQSVYTVARTSDEAEWHIANPEASFAAAALEFNLNQELGKRHVVNPR